MYGYEYGCGPYGHRHWHCHDWPYGPEWGRGPGWGYGPGRGYGRRLAGDPGTRDEVIEDLESYKEELEAEIRRREKRIGSLREKPASP